MQSHVIRLTCSALDCIPRTCINPDFVLCALILPMCCQYLKATAACTVLCFQSLKPTTIWYLTCCSSTSRSLEIFYFPDLCFFIYLICTYHPLLLPCLLHPFIFRSHTDDQQLEHLTPTPRFPHPLYVSCHGLCILSHSLDLRSSDISFALTLVVEMVLLLLQFSNVTQVPVSVTDVRTVVDPPPWQPPPVPMQSHLCSRVVFFWERQI